MSEPVPVLVNAGGGAAAAAGDALREQVTSAFGAAGLTVALELVEGAAMAERVSSFVERDLVVVGGGDGTLGCAASALAGRRAALGILPLGTRNHLARELGIPLDLPGAAKLIAERPERRIDLAEVNGHTFINNASVGFYPELVERRDEQRERRGWPKWLAVLPATAAALARLRHHRLRLSYPGARQEVVTPMLFIGNNRYALDRGRVGQRETLEDGKLSVYAVASHRRLALVGFALRTLLGGADEDRDFATVAEVESLVVAGRSRVIEIALDGEVLTLPMPLRFATRPGALRVIAPVA